MWWSSGKMGIYWLSHMKSKSLEFQREMRCMQTVSKLFLVLYRIHGIGV